MKKQNCSYKKILAKDVAPIASALDPLLSNRLPVGITLTAEKDLVEVPPTGTLTHGWQAVQMTDPTNDETYFVSPRVFLGLAFVEQKLMRVIERKFINGALIDYLATTPKVKVTEYKDVQVDDFATKELVTKAMPVIEPVA